MKLSDILTAERVLLNVKENDKDALLPRIISELARVGSISDPETLTKEVMEREALGNTGIGRGIGFPHAKSTTVNDIQVMLVRPARKIEYGALDGEPVSLILLIVAPKDGDNNAYLHTMAHISRLLGKSDVREKILAAATPEDVVTLVQENE